MVLKHILTLAALLLFLFFFHRSEQKKSNYILAVLLLFPLMDLNVTNESLGGITVFDAISLYAFIFLGGHFLRQSSGRSIYFISFIMLGISLSISSLLSEFPANSMLNTFKYFAVFIYAKLLIDQCVEDVDFMDVIIRSLRLMCLLSVAVLLAQLLFGLRFSFYPELNPNTAVNGEIRYPSFFFDPQIYAQFLAMSSFLYLIRSGTEGKRQLQTNRLLFCFLILVIFLTGGRAGLLGFCLGLCILFLSGKGRFKFFLLSGGLLLYLIVSLYPEQFVVFHREDGLNQSIEVRQSIWKEAYQVFDQHRLFGIGAGDYRDYNLKHSENGYYIIDHDLVFYGTESGYLKILAECGLIGFGLLFFFIFRPIIISLKGFYLGRLNYNIIFLIAAIVSWLTAFLTSNTLDDKRIMILLATLICMLISNIKTTQTIYGT